MGENNDARVSEALTKIKSVPNAKILQAIRTNFSPLLAKADPIGETDFALFECLETCIIPLLRSAPDKWCFPFCSWALEKLDDDGIYDWRWPTPAFLAKILFTSISVHCETNIKTCPSNFTLEIIPKIMDWWVSAMLTMLTHFSKGKVFVSAHLVSRFPGLVPLVLQTALDIEKGCVKEQHILCC